MALNIRSPEVEALAGELARLTGETKTEAVTKAVRDRLERVKRGRHHRSLADELDVIGKQCAALTLNARTLNPRDIKAAIQAFAKERHLRLTEWIIFECSGTKVGQETAFSLLNHGATLAVVGFTMDKVEVRLSNLMAFHARALGNWGCPPELYPAALELVLDGRVKVGEFVEKHPLTAINQVFEDVHAGKVKRRAVLVP